MSDDATMKVALIGCGAVAQLYYTPALQQLERRKLLSVAALFDPNRDRISRLKASFPRARPIPELTHLASLGIDLAIVASPPAYHAEQAIQALESGIAVLCEKPMATSVASGEAMMAAARAAQRVLAIGHFRRFFAATQAIHDLLALNAIGKVESFTWLEGDRFQWPAQSTTFSEKSLAGGGVLLDIGVHVLDLIIKWFGRPTGITYEDDRMGGLEANCRVTLQHMDGARGDVRLSRDWPLANRCTIRGTKGWLSWNIHEAERIEIGFYDARFSFAAQLHEQRMHQAYTAAGRPALNLQQSFVSQLQNVAGAIRGREQLLVAAEEALEGLRLIESCYRGRSLMPMAWLGEDEWNRAQQLSTGSL